MKNNNYQNAIIIIAFAAVLLGGFGSSRKPKSVPNPAVQKCLADGFEIEADLVNGVPMGYRCINPRTGKSCEAWQYYRGECDLSTPDQPAPKADSPSIPDNRSE